MSLEMKQQVSMVMAAVVIAILAFGVLGDCREASHQASKRASVPRPVADSETTSSHEPCFSDQKSARDLLELSSITEVRCEGRFPLEQTFEFQDIELRFLSGWYSDEILADPQINRGDWGSPAQVQVSLLFCAKSLRAKGHHPNLWRGYALGQDNDVIDSLVVTKILRSESKRSSYYETWCHGEFPGSYAIAAGFKVPQRYWKDGFYFGIRRYLHESYHISTVQVLIRPDDLTRVTPGGPSAGVRSP